MRNSIFRPIYRKNLDNWTVCYVVGAFLSQYGQEISAFVSVSERGKGLCFAVFFAPFPEKGILGCIAHRPNIQVFTVDEKS